MGGKGREEEGRGGDSMFSRYTSSHYIVDKGLTVSDEARGDQ